MEVPFLAQQAFQCGPAALAMVLRHSGVEVEPQALEQLVFLPDRRGSIAAEMLAAPRAYERLAYRLPGTLSALQRSLAQGRPVVVLLNLGWGWWPVWHYAVVTGWSEEELRLHSGTEPDQRLSARRFARHWQRAGAWAAVVVPPDVIPEALDLNDLIETLAALDSSHAHLAAQAYEAALRSHPGDARLRFGWSNALANAGQHARAAEILQALAQDQPDEAAVLNNLALAMARSGRAAAALALLETTLAAIGLDNHWHTTLVHTREMILKIMADPAER